MNTIKDHLLAYIFFQLIKEDTRMNKTLDHIYFNSMNKVHRAYVELDSDSDHNFIILEEKMKVNLCEERYHFTRKYNSLDFLKLNYDIVSDPDYINMLQDNNINRLTENLIRVIQCHLDFQAPILKVKSTQSKHTNILRKLMNSLIKRILVIKP